MSLPVTCIVSSCGKKADHYFPSDPKYLYLWLKASQHDEKVWKLKKCSGICSEHFLPSDYDIRGKRIFLRKTAVPSVFPWTKSILVHESRPFEEQLHFKKTIRTYSRSVLPTAFVEEYSDLHNINATNEQDPLKITVINLSNIELDVETLDKVYFSNLETEEVVVNTYNQMPDEVASANLNVNSLDEDGVINLIVQMTDQEQEFVINSDEVRHQIEEKGVQADLLKTITPIKIVKEYIKTFSFSVYSFENSDKHIHFYTGLETFSKLKYVFSTLGDCSNLKYYYYKIAPVSIDLFDQFFMTLIILRRHKEHEETALLFNISCKQVANIFITLVRLMYLQWQNLDLWVSRDKVQTYMPLDFYDKYPMTRVIIDATEYPIKKPTLPLAQQTTFSSYKNKNTIKCLVGIAPNGLITYVSPCYCGSTTDRQIIEKSSILKRFDPNDEIMVDKGLNVQDIFLPYGVKINMPTFFKKENQISPETLNKDRKVASKRVHVERIIGLLKTYKILKEPLNQTETVL